METKLLNYCEGNHIIQNANPNLPEGFRRRWRKSEIELFITVHVSREHASMCNISVR